MATKKKMDTVKPAAVMAVGKMKKVTKKKTLKASPQPIWKTKKAPTKKKFSSTLLAAGKKLVKGMKAAVKPTTKKKLGLIGRAAAMSNGRKAMMKGAAKGAAKGMVKGAIQSDMKSGVVTPKYKTAKKMMKTKPQGKGIVKALGQKGTTGNFAKIEKKEGKGAAIAALQNKLRARRGK